MVSEPARPTVALVVPAYRPPSDLLRRVGESLGLLDFAVIVDDGSSTSFEGCQRDPRIQVICLEENRGIANALNVGIEEARKRGAGFVLTLDQDSSLTRSYVESALTQIAKLRAKRAPVAFVVPDSTGGAPTIRARRTLDGHPVAFDPIQSGALLPVDVFDRVGGFTEELIIDAVDSDFTVRAREHGLECVIVEGTALGHALGDVEVIHLFGRRFHVHKHAPFRTYYMVRNSLLLWRNHGRGRQLWMLVRSRRVAAMVLVATVFGSGRRNQFRALRFGIRDARRRRYGKIPAKTLELLTEDSGAN